MTGIGVHCDESLEFGVALDQFTKQILFRENRGDTKVPALPLAQRQPFDSDGGVEGGPGEETIGLDDNVPSTVVERQFNDLLPEVARRSPRYAYPVLPNL